MLDVRIAGDESAAPWAEVVADLVKRKLRAPVLAGIDGNHGLPEALRKQPTKIEVKRRAQGRNLEAKAPVSPREELREDHRRLV